LAVCRLDSWDVSHSYCYCCCGCGCCGCIDPSYSERRSVLPACLPGRPPGQWSLCPLVTVMDDARTFPILDAINDTLHGRQMTSRRVTSPIVTSSLVGAKCRIVSARDIRCGRGLSGDVVAPARGSSDVTVTSRRSVGANGCVVNGNGKQHDVTSSADDDDVMSLPWHMMSRWCRYAALSNLLALW